MILNVVLTNASPSKSFYFADKCVSVLYTATTSSTGAANFNLTLSEAAGKTMNFDYKDGGIYAMSNSITFPPAYPLPSVSCTTNASIFNTGVNSSGTGTLLQGSTDANWQVAGPYDIAAPAEPAAPPSYAFYSPATVYINNAYYEDPSYTSSQYIGSGSGSEADYYFKYSFNLASSVNPSSFSLDMDFYADNQVAQVYVNGVAQLAAPQGGTANDQYGGFYNGNAASTALGSNWQSGENTIVVDVLNGSGPFAFDAQMRSSASCTPTPPTITNIPGTGSNAAAVYGNNFTATVGGTNSDGMTSVTSSTPSVCTANGTNGLTIDFVGTGTCTLTSHVAQGTEYLPADGSPQSFSVAPIATNLTWSTPAAITYGTGLSSSQLDASVSPNVSGTMSYTLGTANGPALSNGEVLPAGSNSLWATFTPSSAGYASSSTSVVLTVNPAPLTITASSPPSMIYGGSVPAVTASYSGFVNNDSPASLLTKPYCAASATSSSPVASYATTCSGAVDANYTITYVSGSVSVNPAPLNVVASSASMNYGGTTPSITASYSGFIPGDSATSLTPQPSCSTTASSSAPAGTYTSLCSGAVDPNYTISYTSGKVTIGTDVLTIIASSPTMAYGGSVPAVSASYSGFANGDSAGSLTTQPTCSTSATATSPVANYSTSCSLAVDPNYTFVYVSGSLSVTPAPLSITASSAPMTYGGSVPSISSTISGFVNGEGIGNLGSAFSCSTMVTANSPVIIGGYTSSCSGATDPNYSVSYISGSVTVNPAPLSITASSASMVYGGTLPAISPSYSSFAAGDTFLSLTTAPTCVTSATASSSVGSYDASCSSAVDSNYSISYIDGSLTVTPAPLSITASDATMTYGDSLPAITPTYNGLINGDTISSLTAPASCGTSTGAEPAVGSYATTCDSAADTNYLISYVPGTLTVNQALLSITASSPSMTYGGTLPAITPSFSGFVNQDGASSLGSALSCNTVASASSSAASYDTSCSGAVDPNYSFNYNDGSLTINPAPLSITASSPTMNYGGSVPAVQPIYSGFVNHDNASSVLFSAPVCSTTATSSSPVGPYTSSCSEAYDPNYTISDTNGVVYIGQDLLVVVASSPTITYGGSVPAITATYTGFISGEGATSLTTGATCDSTASASPAAGSYVTSCSGVTDSNYNIKYVSGSFLVNQAPLSITASSPTMTYGGSVPTITAASYSGFVNSDSASSLSTQPVCSTSATSLSPAGSYTSSCNTAADPNYAISFVSGTVTVNPAPLSITASSPTMTYGGSVPTITAASYSGFVNSDSASSLSTQPVCSTAATSLSPAGSYTSSCKTAADPNYAISYVSGSVTVNPAPLSITASSPTMTYEAGVPAITAASYSGFVNSDSASSLTTAPTCTTTATNTSVPGSYSTNCSGAVDANYSISYLPGTLNLLLVLSCPNNPAYGTGQNFAGAELHGKNLKGQSFVGANFAGANLSGVNLTGANLTGADLQGADLHGVNLSGANLTATNFVGANLAGVNLQTDAAPCSDLQGANVKGTNLQATNLTGDNLSSAVLQGANLQSANLTTGLLVSADLTGVNLQGDNMTGASLSGATLKGSNTNSITWSNTVCPDGTNSSSDGGSCIGHI